MAPGWSESIFVPDINWDHVRLQSSVGFLTAFQTLVHYMLRWITIRLIMAFWEAVRIATSSSLTGNVTCRPSGGSGHWERYI